MEKLQLFGDSPEARFGHTITQINSTKFILYGGAIGCNGKYAITSDTYLLDLITKKWRKMDPQGSCPNERAAHAAVSVECLQLVLYGGATGGGALASEDLFLLDLRMGEDKATWVLIPAVGTSPGKRYGHSLVFSKPFLIVFGGIPGNDPSNDVFILNVEKSPFTWIKIENIQEIPPVRVYHSASLCNTGSGKGMMVIYGGRTLDQSALNDTWGFRKHRDGRWDWIKASYKADSEIPTPRFQHSTLFLNSLFFVIGGRTNLINETLPIEIYDFDFNKWHKIQGISRFRQANWIFENFLYIHGGLEQSSPNVPINEVLRIDLMRFFQESEYLLKTLHQMPESLASPRETNMIKYGPGCNYYNTAINPSIKSPLSNGSYWSQNIVTLSKKAYVGSSYHPYCTELNTKIRKISIIKLQEESKKIGNTNSLSSIKTIGFKNNDEIADFFLDQLLIPESFTYDIKFQFDKHYLDKLFSEVEKLFQREPSLLRLKSPIKIFGNIHGQLGDLLKLFENFGTPLDSVFHGDIDGFSYLFLGDYIDKGNFSLETLILLFSLKIKHPDSIFLLRGHHEDIFMNRVFGLGEECAVKLEENIDDPTSFFQKINKIFEYLPLAAVIDNAILCVHGGIGKTLKKIEDIERLERPIEISHCPKNNYEKIVIDIILSDPSEDDELENELDFNRDYLDNRYITKFSTGKLSEFLKNNMLKLIIRSHECVMHGYESLAFDTLITVFSTMDYCEGNAACVLAIKKNLEIARKVIYPCEDLKKVKWKNFLEKPFINLTEKEEKLKKKPNTPLRNTKPKIKN